MTHTLDFPFDGQDYRVRCTIRHGQAEGFRGYAMETDDGWMAIEPDARLQTAAEDAAQAYIEAAKDYQRTGF